MGRRAHGEGSIFKRSDGRWGGKLTVAHRDGKRVDKYFYGRTQGAVQKKMTKARRELQQGLPLQPENVTVAKFLRDWLKDIAPLRLRPRTLACYRQHVNDHLVPALGQTKLHHLTPQQVQALLNEKAKKLRPATVARIRATLRVALSQAEKWNLVARNVAKLVDVPKARRYQARVLTPQEARAFVNAATEVRLGAVFSVAMALGLRLGEALGLRWDDIELEGKQLRVRQTLQRLPKGEGEKHGKVVFGEPKSEKSRRVISLPTFAVDLLKRHRVRQKEERLKAGSDWKDQNLVFTSTVGTPVDERNLRREFETILTKAQLPHMRIHDLRHTCASLLLAQGIHPKVVQETLGHSQISLTLDTYSHLIPGMGEEAAKKMDEILSADGVGVKKGVNQPESTPEAAATA